MNRLYLSSILPIFVLLLGVSANAQETGVTGEEVLESATTVRDVSGPKGPRRMLLQTRVDCGHSAGLGVPWLAAPNPAQPMLSAVSNLLATFPYYIVGGVASTALPDRMRNSLQAFAFYHPNVIRHWPALTSSPNAPAFFKYKIVVPPDPTNPSISIPLSTQITSSLSFPNANFGGFGGLNNGSTWNQWISDVNLAFSQFDGCPTANVQSMYDGVYTADYRWPFAPFPANFFGSGVFVWDQSQGGPCGNNVNEIILTSQGTGPLAGQFNGSAGLCLMIFDPINGEIKECDLLFSVEALYRLIGPQLHVSDHREYTALRHEIGHMYGLDHTNLHPGCDYNGPGLADPLINFRGIPTLPSGGTVPQAYTIADFPLSPLQIGGPILPPGSNWPIPGMVSRISYTRIDHLSTPLHIDDQAQLSEIYPVFMPLNGKVPAINKYARIMGRQRLNSEPSGFNNGTGRGIFGRNVWIVDEGSVQMNQPLAAKGTSDAYPRRGSLSGLSRISQTDAPYLSNYQRRAFHEFDPSSPFYSASAPAGPFFIDPVSITGSNGLYNGSPVAGTGDFDITCIPAGSYTEASARAYEVVFEEAERLGVIATNQAEWFGEPGVYDPMANPLPNSLLEVEPILTRNYFGTAPGTSTLSSGMRVVPGTVIAMDPQVHDEALSRNISTGGSSATVSGYGAHPAQPTSGDPYPAFRSFFLQINESYSRPLIDIQPRDGRGSGSTVTIKMKSTFSVGYFMDLSTLKVYLNGVLITTSPATIVSDLVAAFPGIGGVNISPGPNPLTDSFEYQITIPMTDVTTRAAILGTGTLPPGSGAYMVVMVDQRPTSWMQSYFQTLNGNPLSADSHTTYGRNDVVF